MDFVVSSDDEDVINFIGYIGRERRPKIIRNRPNYFDLWDDHDFFVRFRLRKNTVRHVLASIRGMIENPTDW